MRRFVLAVGGLASAALVFAAGIRVGADLGAAEAANLDSAATAALLAWELRLLRAGAGEGLIESKEQQLDGSVVRAMQFQASGASWVFWPHPANPGDAASLRQVAQYRKLHPPIAPRTAPPPGQPDPAGLRDFGQRVEASTAALIERFSR